MTLHFGINSWHLSLYTHRSWGVNLYHDRCNDARWGWLTIGLLTIHWHNDAATGER